MPANNATAKNINWYQIYINIPGPVQWIYKQKQWWSSNTSVSTPFSAHIYVSFFASKCNQDGCANTRHIFQSSVYLEFIATTSSTIYLNHHNTDLIWLIHYNKRSLFTLVKPSQKYNWLTIIQVTQFGEGQNLIMKMFPSFLSQHIKSLNN